MEHKFNIGDIICKKDDRSCRIQISEIDEFFYYASSFNGLIQIVDNDWELASEDEFENAVSETLTDGQPQRVYTTEQIRDIAHRFYELGRNSRGCSKKVMDCIFTLCGDITMIESHISELRKRLENQ